MPLWKTVNGVRVQMTPTEEAEFNASRPTPVADAKAWKFDQIRFKRQQNERAGAESGGRLVSADPESIARLRALQEASTPGQQVPVELVDGSIVSVPAAAITGLLQAAQARMMAAMNAEKAHRDAVDALTDAEAISGYDATTGWPT